MLFTCDEIIFARQDKIFILINHNRTMVQRKTAFKYISHIIIILSTLDKMDSHWPIRKRFNIKGATEIGG